jgi:ribonuclease HII
LLYVALDISERNPCISKRHNEKKESKDLTESPVAFLIALIVHVAMKSQLGVDNEEEVDGYEARKANIEKCSTNSGIRRS